MISPFNYCNICGGTGKITLTRLAGEHQCFGCKKTRKRTMENYLFIDTEGTGFKKGGALVQPDQARVCQIALILTDNVGGILAECTHLIKPDGWEISKGAQDCHGISQEECEQFGLSQELMMKAYFQFASHAQTIVAHGMTYDKNIMEIEGAYYEGEKTALEIIALQKPWYCTMKNSTGICCIPPTNKMKAAGRHNFKAPKLEEAYKHFTGKELDGAHDAMVDARACKDVFFGMRGLL